MSLPIRTAAQVVQDRYRVSAGCLDCAGDLEGLLAQLPDTQAVSVLGAAGVVLITHTGTVRPEQVRRQAARLGVTLTPAEGSRPVAAAEQRWWRSGRVVLLALASVLLLAGVGVDHPAGNDHLALGFYLATIVVGGVYPVRSALRVLAQRQLTIGTLLVAGSLGALALGATDEAAMLVVVFSLGEVLEDYVADRGRNAIRALMSLTPATAARLNPDGGIDDVPVDKLVPDDLVLVKPGERLPTDGQVTVGASAIDQAAITGESIPVEATVGCEVFGGTINGSGALRIRVTKPHEQTVLARVIDQVERAQANRGVAQRFADRFAAIYTPAMFILAAATAAAGPLLGLGTRDAIYRGLVILVVSCSCALVISVPTAVVAAVSRGARDGILIKGGIHLETLARVQTVAFDKTGTLTRGEPQLTDIITAPGCQPTDVLRLAAAVEAASDHPLATAVLTAAHDRGLHVEAGTKARALPGTGVEARVDGHTVFLGRPQHRLPHSLDDQLTTLEQAGKTTAIITIDDQPIGILAIADQLRPDATATVRALHRLGISRVVMLSGDNPRTARAVTAAAGIDDCRAELLPEDKTAAITQLRHDHGEVAMVGDGINDAPALATADIGIAMGTASTDIALETADVALMADQLTKLPQAITLARHTRTVIRQNIALSLATIVLLIAAALTGQLSLTTGLLLNEGSALLIIANGLRLLRRQPRTAQRNWSG